ncbi:MAG: hypothetical protein ACOX04_00595 [Candidatus Scatomorpha sp.]
MRKYTWDEYYEKFYDWAESTQVRNLSGLTSLGTAEKVAEIIIELQGNESASNRLLRKAVEAKLEFSADDLIEFLSGNDEKLAEIAAYNSANRLNDEDIEKLYGMFDDDIIADICSKRSLALPEDLSEEKLFEDDICFDEFVYEKPKKLDFFERLFLVLAGGKLAGKMFGGQSQRRNGICDGNCASCPPHYGYRYGRWYYGHGHSYGCEFGGNKGDGGF